ncbi:unnamed protein product [Coregonus sp. 'balchen']|nr:unnamed protein product [Coregonus sp. 'balchen']
MEGGNEVDLSNNNITPLWKRHSANHTGPSKTKARPLSYQIDRLHMTDFPVEDNKCSFTLSQPAERLVAMPGGGMVILKHLLNQPARKTRVVRSISIGHLPKGRFSLSKFKSKDDKSPSLDNKAYHGGSVGKIGNGEKVWSDQTSPSSYHPLNPRPSPPNPSPSPPSLHTPTPSHSSTSSISSLTSTFSPSDPPTPRSPSPADMSAPSPSPTPSLSPPPSIVLSTHSAAALKTGTQQLIPKGLASLSKVSPAGVQSQALGVLLGLNPTKRALRALSMVETGTFFSTDGGSRGGGEGTDQDESPGTLKRGLRSTSYRRAVVSGVEMEVPSVDPKTHRLSQPVVPKTHRLSQPVVPKTHRLSQPVDPKTHRLSQPVVPKTHRLSQPVDPKTHRLSQPVDPKTHRLSQPVVPKTHRLSQPVVPKTHRLSQPVDPKTHRLSQPVDPKTHRLSQPVLKGLQAVKESPTSPGKKNKSPDKKTGLITQRTFDSEEEELYQNYQEKALHNDSDEDQFKEPKPADRIVVQYRPIRTSWSQLSVAIFELISSEHSYLHSLEILIRMFKNSAELSDTMTKTEHHHLFSNITDVCEASKKFFKIRGQAPAEHVIDDISDIVFRHAQSNFDPYITYCSNEVYQQRTLQRLVSSKNPVFKEVLTRIEAHPDCRNLPMISFLILPMQRVICQKASKDSAQYEACKKALQSVSKVVRKCNEGARTMERTEMMYTINSQLEFKIKPFPLVSSSRWMVKRGELTAFVEENGIFSKRTEDSYAVIDYALRDHIWVGPCQAEDINLSPVRTTAGMLTSRQPGASHLFRLRFRSNHSGDKVPMVLGVELILLINPLHSAVSPHSLSLTPSTLPAGINPSTCGLSPQPEFNPPLCGFPQPIINPPHSAAPPKPLI